MEYQLRILPKKDYPPQLLEIPEPPEKFYLRGALPPKSVKYLAVVGSRALSRYGAEACEKLISGLAGYPISIVSGLALGADAAAHRAALRAGLHTIAIPGSGIANEAIYPRSHVRLAEEILEAGGALLSEFEPDFKPRLYSFPQRNRIMAGIADAILVIEAGEKSGTLITARLASEYNRELLCVPHRMGDAHGFGANLFIRLGAALCAAPEHILEALGITPREKEAAATSPKLEGAEKILYQLLKEPLPSDELIRASRLPPGEAFTALVGLEIRGVLKQEFGTWRRI